MQYQILKFYQSIQNPVLSFIANLLSFAGEQTLLVVVAIIFLFGVSKKTFKRAVGDLYKKRLIELTDAGIQLVK